MASRTALVFGTLRASANCQNIGGELSSSAVKGDVKGLTSAPRPTGDAGGQQAPPGQPGAAALGERRAGATAGLCARRGWRR
eukprot:7345837-Pyramimonas_sp.AAC.1